jgi:hypothetical protein
MYMGKARNQKVGKLLLPRAEALAADSKIGSLFRQVLPDLMPIIARLDLVNED